MRKSLMLLVIMALFVPLLFLGCEGDDGATGATGAQGPQGPQGPEGPAGPGATATSESCGVCHQSELLGIGVETVHEVEGDAVVGNVVATPGASLVVTFNVQVDGANRDGLNLYRAYVNYDDPENPVFDNGSTFVTTFVRDDIIDNVIGSFASTGNGNYTVTVPTAIQNVAGDNATYLFILTDQAARVRGELLEPTVVVTDPAGVRVLRDLVTSGDAENPVGCASCHGPYPAWQSFDQKEVPFRHYAVGGADCQICHSRDSRDINIISRNAAGALVQTGSIVFGTNIVEYVHGIHNSHHMPPDGTYYRTTDDVLPSVEDKYSIGYPSDMRNCKTCHYTEAQLAAAATAPVSYYLCMTCHNNWDGFVDHHTSLPIMVGALGDIHRGLAPTANCMISGCHLDRPTKDEAADFHIDLEASDRHYNSFYGGMDISFANPDNVSFAITGVTVAGDNVTFTWTASKLGAAVNPCNDNLSNGPVFRTTGVSPNTVPGLGAYLAYAKGDDWVNEFVGSSPGQPASARDMFTSLSTTCAANEATTTGLRLDPDTAYADKVLLAIGGKPRNRGTFLIGTADTPGDYFVRVPSPTYAFDPADGSAVVPSRRDVVDVGLCNGCHQGTLYQHGGDRVDNEQLCVICHNPSSGDKNNRIFYKILNADNTVDTSSTYDGKNNETYDMRTMIHAIHGVNARIEHGGIPWVIYRGRGIYAFAPALYDEVFDQTENDGAGRNVEVEVPYPFPTGWPEDGRTIFGSDNNSVQTHNWTVVHYPKPPNNCEGCHFGGTYLEADQTKAVAVTIDPGTSFPDQSDDTVIGPTAAACLACHGNASLNAHAAQFGYSTVVTKEELLELAGP